MELMIIITVLCTALCLLQAPCTASLQIDKVQQYYSHEKVNEVHGDQLSLPRKIRFTTAEVTKQVKGHGGDQDTGTTQNKLKGKEDVPAAGNSLNNKGQGVMHGSISNNKGTRQEWVEGGDPSQYFTMDYSHVRRRSPIHNKSLPVCP